MSAVFDFRAQQRRARRGTAVLVLAFLVMAVLIAVAMGIISGLALAATQDISGLDPALAILVSGVVLLVILVAALIRIMMLGGDGAKVAQSFGGVEVTEDTANPYLRRYLNIVDEMAIAANLPRPRAFILKNESGINAFAAGSSPDRAAVAVTHGALSKLTRAELAGVVGHEMAHIRNLDTRLNMRLLGLVFGLVVIYVVGRGVLRSLAYSRGSRRDNGFTAAALVIGMGLVVLGILGVVGGRVLQAAVSRRREYLADATGVELTRDPSGLAGALKKIGATADGSHVNSSHAEEARHMFFANALGLSGLFATHPPLMRRIRALEPGFDPKTDPLWSIDDRAAMREVRADLGLGPWDEGPTRAEG